jgi:hypothetical protein
VADSNGTGVELFKFLDPAWTFQYSGAVGANYGAQTFTAGTPACIVQRVTQGATMAANIDGGDVGPDDISADSVRDYTRIIFNADLCAYIGPVLISPTRKSDTWTAAIQANSGAAFSDPVRLYREFMAAGDMLLPLVSDSVGYVEG